SDGGRPPRSAARRRRWLRVKRGDSKKVGKATHIGPSNYLTVFVSKRNIFGRRCPHVVLIRTRSQAWPRPLFSAPQLSPSARGPGGPLPAQCRSSRPSFRHLGQRYSDRADSGPF